MGAVFVLWKGLVAFATVVVPLYFGAIRANFLGNKPLSTSATNALIIVFSSLIRCRLSSSSGLPLLRGLIAVIECHCSFPFQNNFCTFIISYLCAYIKKTANLSHFLKFYIFAWIYIFTIL